MQSTIKCTKARPAQVLGAELMAASNDVRMELGKRESLRRELPVRRWKRGVQPPEPATLAAVNLPDESKSTGNGNPQPFFIHDSGTTAPKRMLVFASPEQLRHLATANRLLQVLP